VRIYFINLAQLFTWEPDWNTQWLWQANYHDRPDVADVHRVLVKLTFLWYPLGVLGLLFFGRRAPVPALVVLLFFLVHAAVSHGSYRYMAPATVLFILFSGVLLVHVGRWLREEAATADDSNPPAPVSSPASNTAR
jgi:hypothetical protein